MGQLSWAPGAIFSLDSDVIIYSVERIEPYNSLLKPLWAAAKAGEIQLVGSELLLLETLVKPLQIQDRILEGLFRQLLTRSEIQLVAISQSILEQAARLRAITSIRTPDAIHAATAITTNSTMFLSNDSGYRLVPGFPLALLSDILHS